MLDGEAKRLLEAVLAERGHANVLVVGASGAGKSTLVNAVFGRELAAVGQGRPVTERVLELSVEGLPLTLFDTRGLELERYAETAGEVTALLEARAREADPNRHVHVAWLCIAEESRRVHEAESTLVARIAARVPVLVVITKARADAGFAARVRLLLPEARDVVRVRALEEVDEDGHVLARRGLDDLVERTLALLPEGQRRALVAAQRVVLSKKRDAALEVVKRFERLAAGAGATPVPGLAAGLLVPVHLAMRDAIHAALGVSKRPNDADFLQTLARHGSRKLDVAKAVVGEVLKSAALVGTAPGSVLSGHTAASVTRRCGIAYVHAVVTLLDEAPGEEPAPAAILSRFVRELGRA